MVRIALVDDDANYRDELTRYLKQYEQENGEGSDAAMAQMRHKGKRYISIPVKGGIKKLGVSRITYVEVHNHDLIYHTTIGVLLSRGKLSELEEQLDTRQFFRCGKSHLVNLEFVESVENSDVHVGDDVVRVSRARRKALLDALNDYINEMNK